MSKTLGQRLADLNIEVGTAMTIDWQQVRIQAAMYAMQNIADSLGSIDYNKELIAKHAVELADALVAELKKGGQDETDKRTS